MTYTNLEWLMIFIICLLIATFTGYFARREGKNPYLWFGLGFIFGLIAPFILFLSTMIKRWQDREGSAGVSISNSDSSLNKGAKPLESNSARAKLESEENKLWYYLDADHQQMGPVSIIALRELWNRGQLELNNYVWSEGMEQWQKVDNLPDLRAALNHK